MAHLIAGKGGKDSKDDKHEAGGAIPEKEKEDLDLSGFGLPAFEDGVCPCCFQKYGDQDTASWTDLVYPLVGPFIS